MVQNFSKIKNFFKELLKEKFDIYNTEQKNPIFILECQDHQPLWSNK